MFKSLIVCWCEKTPAHADPLSLFIHNFNSLQAKVCSQHVRERQGGQRDRESKKESACALILGMSPS